MMYIQCNKKTLTVIDYKSLLNKSFSQNTMKEETSIDNF